VSLTRGAFTQPPAPKAASLRRGTRA
jgi:hypothetical protein